MSGGFEKNKNDYWGYTYRYVIFRQNMIKPQNYYCHRRVEDSPKLPCQYKVIEKLGQGSFGEVYKILDQSSCKIHVLKLAKTCHSEDLRHESEIMKELARCPGFVQVAPNPNPHHLIMTILGCDLDHTVSPRALSVPSMKRIAAQLILRLSELHKRQYVHRDIKPANIMLGNRLNPHCIYLVDYGLATTFRSAPKSARKLYKGEVGTLKYCSIASHQGLQQFPKDDLLSLGYVLSHLIRNSLPWDAVTTQGDQRANQIAHIKQTIDVEEVTRGVGCLRKYFKYVTALKITDVIDYDALFSIFDIKCPLNCCYQFCKETCKNIVQEDNEDIAQLDYQSEPLAPLSDSV